jgi:hypothetical protein
VRDLERHVVNTRPQHDGAPPPGEIALAGYRHLRLDNALLSPDHTAEKIHTWLDG